MGDSSLTSSWGDDKGQKGEHWEWKGGLTKIGCRPEFDQIEDFGIW
jgi:hypothetical protein